MTTDAHEILNCLMNCETSLYTCLYAPDKAVVPISNLIYLKKWTKYRMRKALKELRQLNLVEYTSQGCPAIVSIGEYQELIAEAGPPINGYALTSKAFESDMWEEHYAEWSKGIEEWTESSMDDAE